MWITRTSINQPVFATMVMAALLVLGVFSYNRLRVERMPDVVFPAIFIQVSGPTIPAAWRQYMPAAA